MAPPHSRGASQVALVVKNPLANARDIRDVGSIPGSGRSPGGGIGYPLQYSWASLVAQMVKYLPAMQHTWVQSLSWEDPLQEGMVAAVAAKSVQSCLTLCDPTDYTLPGASVRGTLPRVLEWIAMLSPRGSSQPRD